MQGAPPRWRRRAARRHRRSPPPGGCRSREPARAARRIARGARPRRRRRPPARGTRRGPPPGRESRADVRPARAAPTGSLLATRAPAGRAAARRRAVRCAPGPRAEKWSPSLRRKWSLAGYQSPRYAWCRGDDSPLSRRCDVTMSFEHSPEIWRQFPQLVPGALVADHVSADADLEETLDPWYA